MAYYDAFKRYSWDEEVSVQDKQKRHGCVVSDKTAISNQKHGTGREM
jgi:hypothetical protein